ncbi:MAG TPA: heme-binding protein [Thermoanaerobaculia bacterium]
MRTTTVVLLLSLSLAGNLRAQDCTRPPLEELCSEGVYPDGTIIHYPLSAFEVDGIIRAAAGALGGPATIAVVDRAGLPLGVYRKPGASASDDDVALNLARTAAFFSNNQAPLSSRTVRFISGVHFPPGVKNAPPGALYGIEQSNRGCDLGVMWFPRPQCMPRARSLDGILNFKPCNEVDASGCGPGIITGKRQPDDGPYPQSPFDRPVNAGGIPLYRIVDARPAEGIVDQAVLVGGIGVAGVAGDGQLAEFAAATGAFAPHFAPVPKFPLPDPGNVFIDGIRLPFLGPDQRLRFDANGLPIGLEQPEGTSPDATPFDRANYAFGPIDGGCTNDGYLVEPRPRSLSADDVDAIVQRGIAAARRTRAVIRLPPNSYARMVIAVADVDGTILALYRMPDATIFSVDVAVSKARNMAHYNAVGLPGLPGGTFVTSRTIGFGAQPLYPPGIESPPGPWYSLFLQNLATPCLGGQGITFFAGSTPLVRGGELVGGLGVSGDGVEQDDYVTVAAAGDLLPPRDKWADRIKVGGARLPMFKFPRHPEGVTECGGGPCS